MKVKDEFQYDELGRLKFHPKIHFANGKPMTESELEYLCKFYECDGAKSISMALGKTEMSITNKFNELKKNGKYHYYRTLNNYV